MHSFQTPPLGGSPFAPALAGRILHRFRSQGWEGLVDRVCALARKAEMSRNDVDPEHFLTQLAQAMRRGQMLPNSPLLVNCAEAAPRLFACFAVDVDKPASEFLKSFRFIHDGMGGVGYTLKSDESGLAELIRLIDDDTVAHQQRRPRPASNAVTMPISGDLDTFLGLAGTLAVTNMNVALSDAFMAALPTDRAAQQRFNAIAGCIHATGQPGVIFPDRITRVSRDTHAQYAANVCGEAPLAVDESALLASVNLSAFVTAAQDGARIFDEAGFAHCVALCVRMLDGMHDLQTHASEALMQNSLATRKVGVGVMGFAHALMLLGLPYGSPASLQFARRLSAMLHESAAAESQRLAHCLGAYPAWDPGHGHARRNANLTAIAGTATIALIVGTSCGIEPIYSHRVAQRVIDREICVMDPVVSFLLGEQGIDPALAERRIATGESLRQIAGDALADLCPTALELSGDLHIQMQAALQSGIDCGITKTVNCPPETTVTEIRSWLLQAHASGCLGLTIYRNQSLQNQPMQVAEQDATPNHV
ncbi:MAG: hypothetical protein AB1704_21085 [Pseudomonadota bacterium]|jgi:ribonucleoside-diphosphate reductase alpha chain|uniref:hypothetical protein n=1 Tax=Burkholderiaceae TaxID=119060 RepID=UPI001484F4AE|nr:hypothetical protein [Burkholderia sp. 4M9327F10]